MPSRDGVGKIEGLAKQKAAKIPKLEQGLGKSRKKSIMFQCVSFWRYPQTGCGAQGQNHITEQKQKLRCEGGSISSHRIAWLLAELSGQEATLPREESTV
jgi:hypothetical protein